MMGIFDLIAGGSRLSKLGDANLCRNIAKTRSIAAVAYDVVDLRTFSIRTVNRLPAFDVPLPSMLPTPSFSKTELAMIAVRNEIFECVPMAENGEQNTLEG